jgi:hypothetical protein
MRLWVIGRSWRLFTRGAGYTTSGQQAVRVVLVPGLHRDQGIRLIARAKLDNMSVLLDNTLGQFVPQWIQKPQEQPSDEYLCENASSA